MAGRSGPPINGENTMSKLYEKTGLHKVIGRNRYCGPAAISALFGIPTHEAAADIRETCGIDRVMGLYNSQMQKYLDSKGVKYEVEKTKTTVGACNFGDGLYICNSSRHYWALSVRNGVKFFADSGAYKAKKARSFDEFPHKKAKLKMFIKIDESTMHLIQRKPKKQSDGFKPTTFKELFDRHASEGVKFSVQQTVAWANNDCSYCEEHCLDNPAEYVESVIKHHGHFGNSPAALEPMFVLFRISREVFEYIYTDEEKANVRTLLMLAGRYKLGRKVFTTTEKAA